MKPPVSAVRSILISTLAALAACSDAPPLPPDAGASVEDAGTIDAQASDAAPQDAAADAGSDAGLDAGAADLGIWPDAAPVPEVDILDQLRAVDGLQVNEVTAGLPDTRAFLLGFEQPEDHQNPVGARFVQRIILVHRSRQAPMVLHTTGYDFFGDPLVWTGEQSEPAEILDANELIVEHRFFGESVAPEPKWTLLNIEQSANDSHRIKVALSTIYTGDWVGTGVSKGGMTALFHQRYFPNDLAAIVPYVAPISFFSAGGEADARYVPWLDQVGPGDGICRGRVLDMKVELFERRSEMADYVASVDSSSAAFSRAALEAAVTDPAWSFHWYFWQYYATEDSCSTLPTRGGPITDLAAWFPVDLSRYFAHYGYDSGLDPYYYQAWNQLGYPLIVNPEIDSPQLIRRL